MALTDLVDEKRFLPWLGRLLECVRQELAATNSPAPCFIGITPDQPPLGMLDCTKDGCGVVWISPGQIFPSQRFPTADEEVATTCVSPLAMQVEVGIARCAPRPQGRDAQPDPQAYFDSVRLMLADMQAIRRALICCLPQRVPGGSEPPQVSLQTWTQLEGAMGAVGGTWTATIG